MWILLKLALHVLVQAGALQNTVKASQLEIVELQHLVEALRYLLYCLESSVFCTTSKINIRVVGICIIGSMDSSKYHYLHR